MLHGRCRAFDLIAGPRSPNWPRSPTWVRRESGQQSQTNGAIGDGFWSIAARGQLRPDVRTSGAGELAGLLRGMGRAGSRTADRRQRLPVGDLEPDRRIVGWSLVDVDGGRGHAPPGVDERPRCPV